MMSVEPEVEPFVRLVKQHFFFICFFVFVFVFNEKELSPGVPS